MKYPYLNLLLDFFYTWAGKSLVANFPAFTFDKDLLTVFNSTISAPDFDNFVIISCFSASVKPSVIVFNIY